ncbi:MAG: transposase, partial [Clostridium sp.]|nr:transposase [Clostridium sp.]MCM1444031.1 hypothetical protein [Candidatus Amulumruptor caecigallinarius]
EEKEQEKIMNTRLLYAEEEGMKNGMEKGIEKGIEKGSSNKAIEIAKNMLNKNFDLKTISEITNLSISEIENLK